MAELFAGVPVICSVPVSAPLTAGASEAESVQVAPAASVMQLVALARGELARQRER